MGWRGETHSIPRYFVTKWSGRVQNRLRFIAENIRNDINCSFNEERLLGVGKNPIFALRF
jgi:hypothetical protein